ncbi:MAG: phage virion morphogenesis protein [Bacteroidales bacterium]|nr:phage virion morphogenesis protein [Bacteroidales bacterium]
MSQAEFTYKGKPYSFKQVALNFHKVRKQIPGVLGTIAVNYFKDSFRRQGWRDRSLKYWPRRSKNFRKDNGRAILVKSGRLRNSIRIEQAVFARTVVGTSVPYADAHNSGVSRTVAVRSHQRHTYSKVKETYTTRKGTTRSRTMRKVDGSYQVKAHSRKMNLPQRQFMGDSKVMFMKFDKAVIQAVDKIFEL